MKPFMTSTERELVADMDRYLTRMAELEKPVTAITLQRKLLETWLRLCRRQQEHAEKGTVRDVNGTAGTYRGYPVVGPDKRRYTKRDVGDLFAEES